jgi:hypothetical protein
MKITEANFQAIVRYGEIALAISCVAGIYLVIRNIELYRDASRAAAQYQQMMLRQQALQQAPQRVLQEFAERAKTNPKVMEIFQRNQLITTPASKELGQAQEVKP